MSEFYNFEAETLQGESISLESFRGKVVLVVNTASLCGFTPQYDALQSLYVKYKDQGFEVLGFPCNQFGSQEPGDEKSIASGCLTQFAISFPMFRKVDVNGAEAHPLFAWLTTSLPGIMGRKIKWNFTKFLISSDGKPLKRFAPGTRPEALEPEIIQALGAINAN